MPTLLKNIEQEVRAFIKTDIRARWFGGNPPPANTSRPYVTFDTAPETPADKSALPRAFCDLQSPIERAEEYDSMTETGVGLAFRLSVQRLKPEPGTGSVHNAIMADLEAMREVMTTGDRYHGYNREWRGDEWEIADDHYTATINFAVFASVSAK